MSTCPSCAKEVRPFWPTCRSCGTLLMAPPAPVTPVGAAVAEGAVGGGTAGGPPSAEEQFFAPAVLQPIVQLPPVARPAYSNSSSRLAGSDPGVGKWAALIGMVVFTIAAIACAVFVFKPAATAQHQTPVVMDPRAPTAGLPTSLEAIVRIQAESARHTALQTIEQVGNGDVVALATMQPNYKWVGADQTSTDGHVVSVAQDAGVVTIAVAASNKDICAFGRWSPGASPTYVTMAHQPACAASSAPTTGWSNEAGGASSDLPDDVNR
jgi:hypothetical protein